MPYSCRIKIEDGNPDCDWQSGKWEQVGQSKAYRNAAEVQGECLARVVRAPTFGRALHALAIAVADGDHDPDSECPATDEAQRRFIAAAQAVVACWHEHDTELERMEKQHAQALKAQCVDGGLFPRDLFDAVKQRKEEGEGDVGTSQFFREMAAEMQKDREAGQ